MTTNASGNLRKSFAVAGAAVALPLMAVFLFNTLWGYLPLRQDVEQVPYFVHVTNSMRDLEVAILQAALRVQSRQIEGSGTARAAAAQGPGIEPMLERVKGQFSTVRQAVEGWPELRDETLQLYAQWLVLRRQAERLESTGIARAGDGAAIASFEAGIAALLDRINGMTETLTRDVNQRMAEGRLQSQRIYGLTVAIGLMVIMFIMYVNLRLARYVVDPVNGIVGSIRRFREGDYSARTGVQRKDEIGALATAFNEMATDIEQTHEHLSSLTERDPLTGMLNRRGFDPRFDRQLVQADASGDELAIIMVDIDHFKKVNDTYGHAVGDQVLVAVADTIRNCLRAGDFSARFGGEEFVVCMPDQGQETALTVAERIREAIARLPLYDTTGQAFQVTTSAGVAVYPRCGRSRDEILRLGDEALYAAKRGGRNRVVSAPPLDQEQHAPPMRKSA